RSASHEPDIDHRHAEGQRVDLDVGEAGGFDVGLHLLARLEGLDAGGEVAVGGSVAGDPAGGASHDLVEVEVVEPADQPVGRLGELQHDHAPAGPEDAAELAQGPQRIGDVSDAEGDGDD